MTKMGWAGLVIAMGTATPSVASAFELKHTSDGQTMRWETQSVEYVIDPAVEQAIPGATAALTQAAQAWSGVHGAPVLTVRLGSPGEKVAYDGQNSVVLASDDSDITEGRLAVTVSSTDTSSGALLDTDIVLSSHYAFAVLPGDARDPGATPLATDGESEGDDAHDLVFDIQHVFAHEIGHTLGLADAHDANATMYALTDPGSAANRGPESDDEAGLTSLYGDASAPPRHGCSASVAGAGSRGSQGADMWLSIVAVAIAIPASRRMMRRVRCP